jgi:hypothetical protein
METMTTTSYPLDGKAGTNIGKAMTDSSTHRLIEVRLAPYKRQKKRTCWKVRVVPTADSCTAANSVFSLENFVYLGQQCR